VTYFWNGNRGGMFDAATERYEEIPSDRISFDRRPWMKAAEITDRVLEVLEEGRYRFLRVNYANGDMVGHTGQLDATVTAVEAVDLSLARLLDGVERVGGTLLVTADHGNAEDMVERGRDGRPRRSAEGRLVARTSHTTNPVGFWIHRPGVSVPALRADLPGAGLANVAATTIELLGFRPPEDYLPSLLA
jgi:2,3-bisphosphoglycerate-independent phosphoglycerate mutase